MYMNHLGLYSLVHPNQFSIQKHENGYIRNHAAKKMDATTKANVKIPARKPATINDNLKKYQPICKLL